MPPLSGEEQYSFVILDVTKISQLGPIVDIQLGFYRGKKKQDDDEQLAALYLCNIRVQYESNFSAMRNH